MGNGDGERSADPVDATKDDPPGGVKTYECNECGHRVEAEHHPGECPVCGGGVVDISVPRE